MPIYDMKCPHCNHIVRDKFIKSWDEKVKCLRCGATLKRLISTGINAKVFPADGVYLEHVSPKGKTFHSTKEMRDYERKHDVELGYLL